MDRLRRKERNRTVTAARQIFTCSKVAMASASIK
jgi:hypothetical protein